MQRPLPNQLTREEQTLICSPKTISTKKKKKKITQLKNSKHPWIPSREDSIFFMEGWWIAITTPPWSKRQNCSCGCSDAHLPARASHACAVDGFWQRNTIEDSHQRKHTFPIQKDGLNDQLIQILTGIRRGYQKSAAAAASSERGCYCCCSCWHVHLHGGVDVGSRGGLI